MSKEPDVWKILELLSEFYECSGGLVEFYYAKNPSAKK